MESKEFDDIIKNKLDRPVEIEDQRSWDVFMLSAMEKGHEDLFEDHSADHLVRTALKDHTVDYDASTWDSLLEKIKQEEGEPVINSRFDKEISNSLQRVKRKYDAASWPRLAARIEAEEKYLNHYYRAKVVEAVLFFLLVLTLHQVIHSDRFNTSEVKKDVLAFIHPSTEQVISPSPSNSKTEIFGNPEKYTKSIKPGTISVRNEPDKIAEGAVHSITRLIVLKSIPSGLFVSDEHGTRLQAQINPLIKEINTGPVQLQRLDPLGAILSKINLASSTVAKQIQATSIMPSNKELVNEEAILSVPDLILNTAEGLWRIGTYAHTDYNEIKLPDQTFYFGNKPSSFPAKKVNSYGYGAGFKASYIKNRIGFETGLGYANRSYAPNRLYTIPDKLYNASFSNIEYNVIEFPLSFRYGSKGNNRLTSYVQAGINTNFITNAIYDVKVEYKQISSLTGTNHLSQDDRYAISILKDEFTKFDKRRVLIYAQTAAGLEWRATSSVNIYSQITFGQRFLSKQFGPNFDQAKSLSLELGLRTKI